MLTALALLAIPISNSDPPYAGGDIEGFCDTGGPYTGVIDIPVQFHGTANGENPPFSYEWDFSYNGTFNTESTQINPMYTYTDPGFYIVAFRVTDNTSNSSIATTSVLIQDDANTPPIAHFSWSPEYTYTSQEITFTDLSYDLDGNIISWVWDFGDRSSSNSRNTSHMYGLPGSYRVTLTVTDNDGDNSTASRTITIQYDGYYEPPAGKEHTLAIYAIEGRYPLPYTIIHIYDEEGDTKGMGMTDNYGFMVMKCTGDITITMEKEGYIKATHGIYVTGDMRIIIEMTKKADTINQSLGMITIGIMASLALMISIVIPGIKKKKA